MSRSISVFVCIRLSVSLCVCLSVFMSVYISIYVSIYLSVCQSVCLSVCLYRIERSFLCCPTQTPPPPPSRAKSFCLRIHCHLCRLHSDESDRQRMGEIFICIHHELDPNGSTRLKNRRRPRTGQTIPCASQPPLSICPLCTSVPSVSQFPKPPQHSSANDAAT